MKCSACHEPMEIEDRFCARCGTLRPILPAPFARAEGEFTRLRQDFQSGALGRTEYIKAIRDLSVRDESGSWWCLGARSGSWYRFDGERWLMSDPPLLEENNPSNFPPHPESAP